MRNLVLLGGLILIAISAAGCQPSLVLEAQSLPTTLHAVWTPNPASDGVTRYSLTVDTGTAQNVPLTACDASRCTAPFSLASAGDHVVSIRAYNLKLTSDPSSEQASPASAVSFTVRLVPAAVTGATVTP